MKDLNIYYSLEENFYYLILEEVISELSKDLQTSIIKLYDNKFCITMDCFNLTEALDDETTIVSIAYLGFILFNSLSYCNGKEQEQIYSLLKQLNTSFKPKISQGLTSYPNEIRN